MSRRAVSAGIQLGVGLLLVVSAMALYWQYLRFMYELTFLSNFCAGLFFLIAGVCTWMGKRTPQILYLCFAVLLFLVMAVCLVFSGDFSFTGAFLFLHLIDPLAVLAYFFLAADMGSVPGRLLPTALLMPMAYLAFALIFGAKTKNYIYFFLDYNQVGIGYTLGFILIAGGALLLVSWVFWRVNRLLGRVRESRGGTV